MKKAFFKYIFALLLFGSNGIVASNIHLSSYKIVFWRTLIGSLLLIGIFFVTRQKITFAKEKNDTLFIVFSGITMGTSWMFLYEAYNQIGVSLASLSYYCGPVIVMGLSPILFKEKLTAYKIAGFIAVLIGIFLVNGTVSGENLNAFGIFCGIMSAIMYSFMVILNKKSKKVQGLENATIQLLMSFLTVAAFVGLKTGYQVSISRTNLIWVIVLGLFNTGIGCYFYFSSIGKLPVQTVAISGYLEPLSAIILATLILGETMRPLQMIGAVLIIGGAVFGEYYNSHL
ncbi:EamA family transporter [Anaerostipes sp. NSJ-7]|nr:MULTISPECIES: DMT family transporter [Anaerostipes]MBC5678723.1 EamA family transporter [Anaerostipes hominis (ex Liu et al. 2021)]